MREGEGPGHSSRITIALMLATAAAACGDGGTGPGLPDPIASLRADAVSAGLVALPADPVRPVENAYVAERVELGHLLFFDPILSGPRDVACSTCHLPRFAFADGRQFPAGAGATGLGPDRTVPGPWPLREMPRNSPAIFNLGVYGRFGTAPTVNGMMFWSGSAFGIEDQALNPIAADNELRGVTYSKPVAVDSVVARLRRIPEYLDRFAAGFPEIAAIGTEPERLVTASTLRLSIAAYVRELVTPAAPFDAFMKGDDAALTARQLNGLELFVGKAGCTSCHRGPVLSDFDLHVLGARQLGLGRDTTPGDDLGWGEHGGTPYSFRTAPLRQVSRTAPYFHAGTAAALEDVLRFKNTGQSEHPNVPASRLDAAVRPLGLSETEIEALIAFLEALTDTITVNEPLFLAPERVPSGLTIPK